ncbi:hypothetical protein HMI54_014051 [Coelomomyces lativittatus]|nr:hypothetical protein HMI54_014051 [Coelomomyces lativittatus]
MAVDKAGNIWFATVEKGLVKFSNGVLVYYSNQDGLPSNNINKVFVHEGEVWASSGYKKPYEFTPMGGSTTTTPTPAPKPSEKQLLETKINDFEPQFAWVKVIQ